MFFYDCEAGYVPDDGQNDVRDGSVENYPLDWDATPAPEGCTPCTQVPGGADPAMMPGDGPAPGADRP